MVSPASPATSSNRSRSCERVPLESVSLRANARTFALRVPDDSMRAVGLLPGDIAVFEHGLPPRPGDIVAALVDGTSVLRVYAVTLGRPMLRTPDGHGPATRADTVVLQGVMTQLLRSRTR